MDDFQHYIDQIRSGGLVRPAFWPPVQRGSFFEQRGMFLNQLGQLYGVKVTSSDHIGITYYTQRVSMTCGLLLSNEILDTNRVWQALDQLMPNLAAEIHKPIDQAAHLVGSILATDKPANAGASANLDIQLEFLGVTSTSTAMFQQAIGDIISDVANSDWIESLKRHNIDISPASEWISNSSSGGISHFVVDPDFEAEAQHKYKFPSAGIPVDGNIGIRSITGSLHADVLQNSSLVGTEDVPGGQGRNIPVKAGLNYSMEVKNTGLVTCKYRVSGVDTWSIFKPADRG